MGNRTRSLVLVNYFHTVPLGVTECAEHSMGLVDVLRACHAAAGDRWANFMAVDYYKVRTYLILVIVEMEGPVVHINLLVVSDATSVRPGFREATAAGCSMRRTCSTGCSSAVATTCARAG
jgi:hypothetical protein